MHMHMHIHRHMRRHMHMHARQLTLCERNRCHRFCGAKLSVGGRPLLRSLSVRMLAMAAATMAAAATSTATLKPRIAIASGRADEVPRKPATCMCMWNVHVSCAWADEVPRKPATCMRMLHVECACFMCMCICMFHVECGIMHVHMGMCMGRRGDAKEARHLRRRQRVVHFEQQRREEGAQEGDVARHGHERGRLLGVGRRVQQDDDVAERE